MRWRLDLSYDGAGFSGWASQHGLRTVQGELEDGITTVLRLPERVRVTAAGRTDAGVHARGQVAHVDLPDDALTRDARSHHDRADGDLLRRRLTRLLSRGDLVVRAVAPAPPGFDARFAAVWRRYVYRVADGEVPPDPLLRGQVTHLPDGLDLGRVNDAAADLLGLRDFGAFCRRREGATTVRTLLELHAVRVPAGPLAGVVEVTVRADAFCHSMVRALVGGLTVVGRGARDRGWLAGVAAAAVRDAHVPVLPPHGLTLEEVGYPAGADLAARAAEARAVRVLP